MIGIAEKNLDFELAELLGRHRLHRSLSAYGHENGCFDHAVSSVEPPAARAGVWILSQQFEFHQTRWQATSRPSASFRRGGSSTRHRSTAMGHRVWKRQPAGGFIGVGTSPFR